MTDNIEIMFVDSYRIPGNTGAMVVDIVYKNNTASEIRVGATLVCGSMSTIPSPTAALCIPPFATSGYYLSRSKNIQTCPTSSTLNIWKCSNAAPCDTYSCIFTGTWAVKTVPVPRVVTIIPTEAEVIAKVTSDVNNPPTIGTECNKIFIDIKDNQSFKKGSVVKITGAIQNCDGFQTDWSGDVGGGHQIYTSPAAGGSIAVRTTVDIDTYRILDKTVDAYYHKDCVAFGQLCREIHPNWDAGTVAIPETVKVNGVDVDTKAMSITIIATFAGNSRFAPSAKTVVAHVNRGPVIEAIDATPISVECQAPCDAVIEITWKNNGDEDGIFTPKIIYDIFVYPGGTEQTLKVGTTVKKSFTLTGMLAGQHVVTADPPGKTVNITVTGIIVPPPDCVPIWQCEYPLNGYKNDGCGNRVLDAGCNSNIIPPPSPPPGDGTGILLAIGLGAVALLVMSKKK